MLSHTVFTAVVCFAALCEPMELRVWDGDTLRIGGEPVRIMNVDTPEIGDKARCRSEGARAVKAKDRLAELLQSGKVRVTAHGRDKYRRTLAVISVRGRDVGDTLVAEGLARTWSGRREPWC